MVEKEETTGIKARSVLWYLAFFGFAINYIVRINANIAIVEMVDKNIKKPSGNKTIITSECIIEQNFTEIMDDEIDFSENKRHLSIERRILDFLKVMYL